MTSGGAPASRARKIVRFRSRSSIAASTTSVASVASASRTRRVAKAGESTVDPGRRSNSSSRSSFAARRREAVADALARALDRGGIDVVEDDIGSRPRGRPARCPAPMIPAPTMPDPSSHRLQRLERLAAAAAVEQRAALGRTERAVHRRHRPRHRYGQRVSAGSAGGAIPASRRALEAGAGRCGPRSTGLRTSSRRGPAGRSWARWSAIVVRMTSRAGQPTNVGRIATSIASGATATRWTIPRSTTDRTGSSGSGTSARAARTWASVGGVGGWWLPDRARAIARCVPPSLTRSLPGRCGGRR